MCTIFRIRRKIRNVGDSRKRIGYNFFLWKGYRGNEKKIETRGLEFIYFSFHNLPHDLKANNFIISGNKFGLEQKTVSEEEA